VFEATQEGVDRPQLAQLGAGLVVTGDHALVIGADDLHRAKTHGPSEPTVADGVIELAANTAMTSVVSGCWRKHAHCGCRSGVVCTVGAKGAWFSEPRRSCHPSARHAGMHRRSPRGRRARSHVRAHA